MLLGFRSRVVFLFLVKDCVLSQGCVLYFRLSFVSVLRKEVLQDFYSWVLAIRMVALIREGGCPLFCFVYLYYLLVSVHNTNTIYALYWGVSKCRYW